MIGMLQHSVQTRVWYVVQDLRSYGTGRNCTPPFTAVRGKIEKHFYYISMNKKAIDLNFMGKKVQR